MHSHLVAIKVRVEGGTDQGVNLDGLALDQKRLKSLDAQTVQRGGAVEQHWPLLDYLFQDLPDLGTFPLDDPLGPLDVVGVVVFHQLADHKRTIELQGHTSGQAALV